MINRKLPLTVLFVFVLGFSIAQDLESISRTYLDAYFTKDQDTYQKYLAENVVWSDPTWSEIDPSNKPVKGKTAVLAHLQQATAEISDMTYSIEQHYVSGQYAIFEGILNYAWENKRIGKTYRFAVREVSILQFDGDKIITHTDYTDFKEWNRQFQAQNEVIKRKVENNILTSEAKPKLKVKVDGEFQFLGKLDFVLFGSAKVERFLFGVIEDKKIQKMITFQFEEYLPHTNYTYRRRYTDSLSFGGLIFGNHGQQIGLTHIGNFIKRWQDRGLEHEVTYQYLKEEGYAYEDLILGHSMVYYGPTMRHECIIVYYDNLSNYELKASDLGFDSNIIREGLQIDEIGNTAKQKKLQTFRKQLKGLIKALD